MFQQRYTRSKSSTCIAKNQSPLTGLEINPNGNCLGVRPIDPATGDYASHYTWLTYLQVEQKRKTIGSALVRLAREGALGDGSNFKGTKDVPIGWRVGLWSSNRPGEVISSELTR
jgi:hypothetical protein